MHDTFAATKDNDFAYDWLPKRDTGYDVLALFDRGTPSTSRSRLDG